MWNSQTSTVGTPWPTQYFEYQVALLISMILSGYLLPYLLSMSKQQQQQQPYNGYKIYILSKVKAHPE